jgi:hypothetical protein
MAKASMTEQLLDELDGLLAKRRITQEEYDARRAAIMSGAVQAPQSSKGSRRGGIFKWGFLGCLGIFAVVGLLVIVILIALAAAVSDSSDKTADSGGDVHVTLANGAVGEIAPEANGSKKSRVTVVQFVDNVQSTNQFLQPQTGKKWVGFEVIVENVGSKQVSSLDWTLRDSKDLEHGREFVTAAEGANVDVVYSDLSPGGKKQGWVYFTVDADATVKWLRADPNPFLANDLYFDVR